MNLKQLKTDILATLFFGYYLFFFFIMIGVTIALYYVHMIAFLLCLLFLGYKIFRTFDKSEYKVDVHKKSYIRELCTRALLDYFPMKLHVKDGVRDEILKHSKDRKIIIGNHPHGVMAITNHVFDDGDFELKRNGLGSLKFKKLAARVLFKIPFTREVNLKWFDAVDASRRVANKVMESKDWNMFIIVGGEREQLLGQKDPNIVYAKNRKGFVRIAMKYGASIVPCYSFGETEMYRVNFFSGIFMGFRLWMCRNFGIALFIPLGTTFFPLFPKRVPVNVVLGKPIIIKKHEDEKDMKNDEIVRGYLQEYMDGLEDVFEEYKDQFGFEKRKLKFL